MARKSTKEAVEFTMEHESNLMTLHDLIVYAHDEMGNTRALSKDDFTEHGLSEQEFDQWEAYVEEMRQQVIAYNAVAHNRKSSDEAIEKALNRVWIAWRSVLKNGTESEFNKNFFIREHVDTHLMAEWAGLKTINTARGKNYAPVSKTNFRRNVEIAIGIRMAGNAVLSDEQRDLITAYEGAIKTVKYMTAALNDKIEKGRTIAGLRTVLRTKEIDLEDTKKLVETMTISDADKQKLLSKDEAAVKQAKDAVTDAEKKLKVAQKTIDDKEKDYNKTVALLKSIGDER